MEIDVMDIY